MSIDRPWLSQFDLEVYHWEENREHYKRIFPNDASKMWLLEFKEGKKTRKRTFRRLDEAAAEKRRINDQSRREG